MGHEYFHNWTGNRVTCRDWFQLTLKEGLTVFRDQVRGSGETRRGTACVCFGGVGGGGGCVEGGWCGWRLRVWVRIMSGGMGGCIYQPKLNQNERSTGRGVSCER